MQDESICFSCGYLDLYSIKTKEEPQEKNLMEKEKMTTGMDMIERKA